MTEAPPWLNVRVVPDYRQPDTWLEIVVTGPAKAPIGPRLAKGEPLPDWPTRFPVEKLDEAKAQAARWDAWITKQNNPKLRVKGRDAAEVSMQRAQDDEPPEDFALAPEPIQKPAPAKKAPTPPPAPKPKPTAAKPSDDEIALGLF